LVCKRFLYIVNRVFVTWATSSDLRISSFVQVTKASDKIFVTSTRLATRAGLVINLSSSGRVRQLKNIAKCAELPVVTACNNDMPIACLESLVGHDVEMCIAKSHCRSTRCQKIHGLIGQHARHAIQTRDIDMLPLPTAGALNQGRLNSNHAVKP
jgi:hypothetical protein